MTICGTFLLTVVEGTISICGAKLFGSIPPTTYPVYAPQSHSLPVIIGLKSRKKSTSQSVIYLKNHNPGISALPEMCQISDHLFNPSVYSAALYPKDPTFSVLLDYPNPVAQVQYPVSWREASQQISRSSCARVIICGPKGVGKSTFSQYLSNSLVGRGAVSFLETDPGQPSFSPAGLISLHSLTQPILSPPFIRSGMANMLRCQHIGNISPRDNPRYYIDCIAELLAHDPLNAPMVINTPGWTKGTGYELLTSIIEVSKPAFIVVVSIAGNDALARSLQPVAVDNQSHLLVIESANTIPPSLHLTASELRTLGIMNYLHASGPESWDFDTHLTAWTPWVVKFTGPKEESGIWAVAIQGEELVSEDILCAINGTLVAIIIHAPKTGEDVAYTPEGIPVLRPRDTLFMDPKTAHCVGYAVIRSIDVKMGWIFLLSPWDPSNLQDGESVVLERGRVNVPVCGIWDHQNPRTLGPWLQR